MAQVSTNISDYNVTPIHKVYEEVCKDAAVSLFYLSPRLSPDLN